MIAVSNDFKNAMKSPVKELQAYITGDVDIKSEDDLISFKISCDAGMCKTAMRKLEAKYTGEYNLLGQEVHVGYGVRLSDGTFEYLDYGSFLVTEISYVKDTGITTIVGYDKMVKSMVPYEVLDVEYPVKLIDYTKQLCNACNLELANDIFGDSLIDFSKASNYASYSPYNFENDIFTLSSTNSSYTNVSYDFTELFKKNKGKTLCFNFESADISNATNPTVQLIIKKNDNTTSYNQLVTPSLRKLSYVIPKDVSDIIQVRCGIWSNNSSTAKASSIIISKPILYIGEQDNPPSYRPYNTMNDYPVNQELWENIDGITYRDIFQQIAQATGTTCIIKEDKVYFKCLNDTNESLTYDNMFKLKLEEKYGEINSVVLSRTPQEDNIYMRDEESIRDNGLTEFKIENNEIIDKDRDNAMTPIYEALKGISYYPFETTTEGLGWYEIGDKLDIVNDLGDVFNTALFNYSITIDGSIKETLKTTADTKTQTQYQYATTIGKRIKNTEIIVNKQEQYIESLVTDVYDENGVINGKFTKVYQDVENIINTVQNSGGNNLLKNSVMFAYEGENVNDWTISGDGQIIIDSNTESLNAGCLSGHGFTLLNKVASQTVLVNTNSVYSFTTRVKKAKTGTAYIKVYNSNEEYLIEISNNEEVYYKEYEFKGLQPTDNYYIVELYGSADSDATFTDNMFSVGEYKSQWTQANGEVMNTQVKINVDGVLVKSSVYLGDYTVMSPLEFAGYSNLNGTITKVFTLNKDTTYMRKAEIKDEVKMVPIKIVPITKGELQGWAFVPATTSEEV